MVVGLSHQMHAGHRPIPVTVNGVPGLAILERDELDLVIALTMERDRISRIDIIRAPEKLAHIREQFRGY